MWGAIIGGVIGLGQTLYGASQKKKAANMSGPAPIYSAPDIYASNVGLLEKEAQTGFSQQSLSNITQALQQNMAVGSNAILQGGGSVNDISKLYEANAEQVRAISAENDKLRMSKLSALIEARNDYAGQKMMEWKINLFDRWKDKQAAAAAMAASGNAMINSGLNTMVSSIGQGVQYAQSPKIPSGGSPDNSQRSALKAVSANLFGSAASEGAESVTGNPNATALDFEFRNQINQNR